MAQDPSSLTNEQLLAALRQSAASGQTAPAPAPAPRITMGDDALMAAIADAEDAGLAPDQSIMDAIEAAPAQEPYLGQSGAPVDLTKFSREQLIAMDLGQGVWVVHPEYENGEPFPLAGKLSDTLPALVGAQRFGDISINPPQRWDQDVVRSGMTGAIEGITGLAGLPGTVQEAVSNLTGMPRGYGSPFGRTFASGADLDALTQNVIGDYYEPQTTAGEYARTIGQNLLSAVVPGGVATRAASVLVPAVASESAGQLTEGTAAEPWARGVAGLLGGGAVAGVSSVRNGVTGTLQNATRNVTDDQLNMAAALRGRSPVALSGAEAINGIGAPSSLARVQRIVEGSSDTLAPMIRERPAQVQRALANVLDQIAPPTTPGDVAGRAQVASTKVLDTLRQRVNESAQPFYDRLPGQTLSPKDFAQLANDESYALAQSQLRANPVLSARAPGAPEDLSTVNEVLKRLRTMRNSETPSAMNTQGDGTLAGEYGRALDNARRIASQASPDFATARQTVATGREAFVEPVRRGPIGAMAAQNEARPTLPSIMPSVFPAAPFEGQSQETVQALRLLGQIDPSVGPALTRQHIAQQATEATQQLQSGENAFGGANIAARLFGNAEQGRTIMGAVDTVAPQASPDLRNLVEALRATGTREAAGSNTAFNTAGLEGIRRQGPATGVMSALAEPWSIPRRMAGGWDNFVAQRNVDRLGALLAGSQEDLNAAIQAARAAPRGSNTARLLAALLQSQGREEGE